MREINLKDMSYELAGIQPSMFDEKSEKMHLSASKSTLKTKLQVQVTDHRSILADATILDGCAILSLIDWPAHGAVKDFVRNVVENITRCLQTADTYLMFDRYYQNSTKEATCNVQLEQAIMPVVNTNCFGLFHYHLRRWVSQSQPTRSS